MTFYDFKDFRRDIVGVLPVSLEPILKLVNFTANLNVQLHIVNQPGKGEVAGADER